MKNLVLFQIGCIETACNIMNYTSEYFLTNTFFLCSVLDSLKAEIITLENIFHKLNIPYQLFFHPNKGMDIGPYLLQLNYIFKNYQPNSFEQIYKIHTKTNIKWRNEMIDQLFDISSSENKWLIPIDSLNTNHINLMCEKFNIPNMGPPKKIQEIKADEKPKK